MKDKVVFPLDDELAKIDKWSEDYEDKRKLWTEYTWIYYSLWQEFNLDPGMLENSIHMLNKTDPPWEGDEGKKWWRKNGIPRG